MKSAEHLVWLAAPAALAASSVPAAGQVFLNEAQALAAIFGEQVTVRREQRTLSEAERRKLQESSGLRFSESSYTFFHGERGGQVAGYALVLDEIGKSEPITFMVGMNPEGKVTEVVVMVFRESRGWEVKDKRFLRQFRGKTLADPMRINQDILNYSGATLSSKAVARGVKRALLLLDVFYPRAERRMPRQSGRLLMPAAPSAVALAEEAALYRQARYCMGTLCEIRVWARSAAEAARSFAAGFAELRHVDQVFSNYREDSELACVNRAAADGPVKVSPEFWELTRYAVRQWRHSRGSFDVTVGPLLKAWGFWQGNPGVPRPREWTAARERVGTDKLELDPRRCTVHFRRRGMELDFGGLAKGYAAQRVARVAQAQGSLAVLVNLGGSSLYAAGAEPHWANGEKTGQRQSPLRIGDWPVGIADPRDPGRQSALHLVLEAGWALSTSGTYVQQCVDGGKTLSHLINPHSGAPVESLRSATVLARSGRRSEALTKQLLVFSGPERKSFPRNLCRNDWALIENLPGGSLRVRQHFRRTSVLVPWPEEHPEGELS